MRSIFALLCILLGLPAHAHPSHLGELAGHDHVVAGIAIGIAIAIGLAGVLAGLGKEAEAEAEEEEDVPA